MKHGSLFSGIGGFDLAAEWVGWENVLQVENDKFCNKVLKKNFPNVKRYGDIKEFKGKPGQCDIISGGFPCQPFSHAGKRQGETDDRYLWPEMLRVISEIKPSWVVGENVAGLISLENGKTLERIFTDLEAEGYQVESFIIPACGVGAWHRRDRIWIVAYNMSIRCNNGRNAIKEGSKTGGKSFNKHEGLAKDVPNTQKTECKQSGNTRSRGTRFTNNSSNVPNANNQGLQGSKQHETYTGETKTQYSAPKLSSATGDCWAVEPELGRMVARLSGGMDRNIINLDFISHLLIFAYVKLYYNGKKTKESGIEILRTLRSNVSKDSIQWKIRGFCGIQEKKILLTYLCKLEKKEFKQKWLSLESKKISESKLRKLWNTEKLTSASYTPKSGEQQSGESSNPLQTLSRFLAFYTKKAWDRDSRKNAISGYWDKEPEGIPRVAKGIKNRTDRLKGLGNSIVPQVAYELFKAIENETTNKGL